MYTLHIHYKGNKLPPANLPAGLFVLGNTPDANLPVAEDDEQACQLHLEVSTEGVKFNRPENHTAAVTLNGTEMSSGLMQAGDVLHTGDISLELEKTVSQTDFSRQWSLQVKNGRMGGQRFAILPEGKTLIGRGKECEIVIPDPHLSKKHAEIRIENGAPVIRDLNSSVGTYVNDALVLESALQSGDKLRLDIFTLVVLAPGEESAVKLPAAKTIPPKSPEEVLKNIQSMKNQEYEEKEWITKPTSVGNRTHVVPGHQKRFGSMFWIALVLTSVFVTGAYWLLSQII